MLGQDGTQDGQGSSRRVWIMALLFGGISVAWTYGFEQIPDLPLWPAFIASATVFAAGGGPSGLGRGLAANLVGAIYAWLTLWVVAAWLGGGTLALSLVVGAAMLVASLHPLVPGLRFTPGAFLGYASLFSVHAAGASLIVAGLTGELMATAASMTIGALIGAGVDLATGGLAGPVSPSGSDPESV